MNHTSSPLSYGIKLTITIISLVGIILATGLYYYYQKEIAEQNGYTVIISDIDSISESESLTKTLESISTINSEENLSQEEVKSILQNAEVSNTENQSLSEEERNLIIKNNTATEFLEN